MNKCAIMFSIVFLAITGATTSLAAAPPSSLSSIEKIVTPENIGLNLNYVEYLVGSPARTSDIDITGVLRGTYEKDGCPISIGSVKGKVVSVGVYITSDVCDIDLGNILGLPHMKASQTTYATYAKRGPLHFTDGQIPSCNACGEGFPEATIDGYSAIGNFDIMIGGWGDLDKAYQWKELLSGIEKENLPMTKQDCPLRKFDTQAFELMKDAKVESIAFGTPGSLQPVCSAKTVHDFIRRQ